jgi:hypothetical protein
MKGILLDDDLDLKVINGTLAFGDTTFQNQKILILANKGELKQNPMRGVGAIRFIEESNPDNLAREIRTEFIADGMSVERIKIDSDFKIDVAAFYK